MNIMRKLWINNNTQQQQDQQQPQDGSTTMNPQPQQQQQQQPPQSISLACMHLRKLYGEYTHSNTNSLLYNMLPIFCKLFNNLTYPELTDRFPETLHFTSSISRLLVLELRKRASSSSTTEAANAIITYLYPKNPENPGTVGEGSTGGSDQDSSTDGFMLLSTINLLSCTDETVIELMCSANVPSTLVKCLYLFFDLGGVGSEREYEAREIVQKVFVQVLIRVCSYSGVSEELCKKDDLALLFSCVSSWCVGGNKSWRKAAGDVLMSVSTHGLSSSFVVGYLHNKACICLCVDNLRRGGSSNNNPHQEEQENNPQVLTPQEITECVFTIFCFLKDSAPISPVLLDDFKSAQGYNFLTDLALILESSPDYHESLCNLVTLVTSLTTCGVNELKPNPQNSTTPFTLPNFELPESSSNKQGSNTNTIRNTHAFSVLVNLFHKSRTSKLDNLVLDSIASVFRADKQNYFIVDSVLPQMAEKLVASSKCVVETQIKYLGIIEFLVFELNFTPCKELIALSRVLKSGSSEGSSGGVMFKLLVLKCLVKILKYSGVIKEAYREIGLLEVAFGLVESAGGDSSVVSVTPQLAHLENDLRVNVLEMISILISGNNQNLNIFREANTAVNLMKLLGSSNSSSSVKTQVFGILSVCFTSQGGEEEFTHALVWMQQQREGRHDVVDMLGLFIGVFKESHRARCNFRKAGGFLYLMSLVVGMEGCFGGDGGVVVDRLVEDMKTFQLVFGCFGLAMRFEPANAKLFQQEICLPSLADTIRLLSHFTQTQTLTNPYQLSILEESSTPPDARINEFHKIFSQNDLKSIVTSCLPLHISLTLFTYRVLYDLALDNYDKPSNASSSSSLGTNQVQGSSSTSPVCTKRLNLNYSVSDPVIVHSGVVIIMIRLLPSIKRGDDDDEVDSCLCQLYCAELVKSLVRSERNQQIMAGVGVCSEIIERLGDGICDEKCVVHSAVQYVFERVGTHSLSAGELRKFLRLGNPLNCNQELFDSYEAQTQAASTPVPLSRVKTLVSMTTPRSSNSNDRMLSNFTGSNYTPSFVEFDMSAEGFGCLFIPSLGCTGVNYSQDFVVQSASLLSSGIGSSNSSTLGYSTWFCIDKFSDPKQDPHPVRLLSLIKESSNGVQRLCLTVLISSRDRALIISTKESGLPPPGIGEWEPDPPQQSTNTSQYTHRIWTPDIHESTWTHVTLNFHNGNTLTVFINGRQTHQAKIDPPQRSKHSTTHTYSAFIGTPPMWRKTSRLSWKQGVSHLFEDFIVTQNTAAYLWKLGPGYLGSFQSVRLGANNNPHDHNPKQDYRTLILGSGDPTILIPEEKLLLGLNSIAVSSLTLQKIRKLYSKSDAKAIARQLGLSSHENATPIQILHNSTAHLLGPTPRPIGGICIGYLGVRVFIPNPVYKSVFSIGGIRILISLIALSNTSESLYASLKALVCVLKNSNVRLDKSHAQVIGFVLKSKKPLLSMRVLHLVFSLVEREHGFAELLGDLEIWVSESGISDLEKALYDHFVNLINDDKQRAIEYFVRAGVLASLLSRTTVHLHNSLFQVISLLIRTELVCFGWFVADTLDTCLPVEKQLTSTITIRNKCLQLLHTCMYTGKTLNVGFCEDVIGTLGFDFVLLFCSATVHVDTVVWGMRILMLLLNSSGGVKNKFRDGVGSAFCFKSLALMQSRSVVSEVACLGLKRELSRLESESSSVGVGGGDSGWKGKDERKNLVVGGWGRLSYSLCQRILSDEYEDLGVEVWLVICALVLSQGVRSTVGYRAGDSSSSEPPLTLELIWSYVFPNSNLNVSSTGQQTSLYGKVSLCPDAIMTLLTMTRCHVSYNKTQDVPNTVTQFLCYLYSNTPEFQTVFTSVDVLTGLSLAVIPVEGGWGECDSVFDDDDGSGDQGTEPDPRKQVLISDSPAKKIMLDFLRIIIIDWMNSQGGNQKPNQNVVIDTVLDAVSSNCVSTQLVTDFNTRLLGTLLDHLISCEMDRVMGYLNAVAGFLCRLVDKIWLESFERDSIVVLDFIVGVVGYARCRRNVGVSTIDSVYNSLNRVILYILSRRVDNSGTSPWMIVEVLRKLRSIRGVVFSPHNHAQEFFACLTYVLIQLGVGGVVCLDVNSTSKWHVVEYDGSDPVGLEIRNAAGKVWEDVYVSKKPIIEELFKVTFPSVEAPGLRELRDLVFDSAVKYWGGYLANELSSKKSSVSCHQSWEIHAQLQSKIQKVTGGLSRLARSSIRKDLSVDKELGSSGGGENPRVCKRNLVDSWGDARKCEMICWRVVGGIKEGRVGVERMRANDSVHFKRFVCDSLLPRLEKEVTRERGVWGGERGDRLDKWMMDTTEGPCRMRKKVIKNEWFYLHYPYVGGGNSSRPGSTSSLNSPCKSPMPGVNKSIAYYHHHQKNQAPVSKDSFEYYQRCPVTSLFDIHEFGVVVDEEEVVQEVGGRSPLASVSSVQSGSKDEESNKGEQDGAVECGTTEEETHSTVLFRLIDTEGEKISQIFRVAQIQGLDSVEGLLLFGKEHFYLISGFTILTKTREIRDIFYLGAGGGGLGGGYEAILPQQCYGNGGGGGSGANKSLNREHEVFKLAYDDVREVLKRRYLLQPIALEIFCSDGRNYLCAFPRKIRNVVFSKFTSFSKLGDGGVGDGRGSVAGQKRTTSVEGAGGLFSSLIGETSVTQRWVRGEISNFQYLMHLNTLAGRSYNDLMQYPVFPWILSNYDSPYLDLSDPKNFRDLSKPMGAQTPGRLVQFVKRYKEWDDPHGETPPYHYGTHYSSAMIVCSYLVRMEPFAQHFLRLQGGHFDLADRMFHSVKEAWTSASRHNMADVKELIPEFFYLPEFLKNCNKFELGVKQNGVALDDVVLPPWAKNDAREFIRVNRMALECDYVSSRLHEWIDLIFGWRQQGGGAVDSVNVFHHLFYEGNVDIYSIDDPLKKNATIGFINNFGQIPKQLFKRAHPQKKVFGSGGSGSGSVMGIGLRGSSLLDGVVGGVHQGGNAMMNTVGVLVSGSVVGNFVSGGSGSGSADKGSGDRMFYHAIDCLRPSSSVVKELKGPVGQILPLDNNKPNSIIAVEQNKQLLSNKFYVSWGFADCSLRICHVDSDRATVICELTQNVDWNGEIVACAVANEKIIVTGQTNSVISVWELSNSHSQAQPTGPTPSSSSNANTSSGAGNSLLLPQHYGSSSSHATLHLKQNLHGHSDSITCLATSPAYNIILSGSKDKTCIVWDLARLTFTRQLGKHDGSIDSVAINECSGDLASADGGVLRVWDINGGLLAVVDTARGCSLQSTVLCIGFSVLNDWDCDNVVVTGGSDGVVRFWSLVFGQVRVGGGDKDSSERGSSSEEEEVEEEEREGKKKGVDKSEEVDPDKDTDSLEEEVAAVAVMRNPVVAERRKMSGNRNSGSFLSTGGGSGGSGGTVRRESLRGSRSEGNLQGSNSSDNEVGGSFEVLNEREIDSAFSLAEGCVWGRSLVFRGKLSLHTSYGRKDNLEPASITAVGVGKDHKTIYIGDARGRVYAWSVTESSAGGRADHWVRDEVSEVCTGCSVRFSLTERKHHCRNCGQVFCGKCSRYESEIFRLKILKPVRVCGGCFAGLKGKKY